MKPSSSTALHSVTLLALLTLSITSMVGVAGLSPFPGFTPILGVLLGIEFLIYAGVLAAVFSRVDILHILALAGFSVVLRGGICMLAGAIGYALLHDIWRMAVMAPQFGSENGFVTIIMPEDGAGVPLMAPHFLDVGLNLWVNIPHLAALQIALVLMTLVSYLGVQTGVHKDSKAETRNYRSPGVGMESRVNLPMGGFIQCYSYSDLNDLMRKLPGVMGFALATDEGLLVTGEGSGLPFPLDSTVVRLQIGSSLLSDYQRRSGLPVDELWQFSEEYTLIMMSVEPCFFLLVFVRPTVELHELRPRISALRRSAEIFLTERHNLLVKAREQESGE